MWRGRCGGGMRSVTWLSCEAGVHCRIFCERKRCGNGGRWRMAMAEGSAVVLDEEAIRSLFHNNMSLEPDELEFCSFLNMIVETERRIFRLQCPGKSAGSDGFSQDASAVEGKEISAIYERKNTCVSQSRRKSGPEGSQNGRYTEDQWTYVPCSRGSRLFDIWRNLSSV